MREIIGAFLENMIRIKMEIFMTSGCLKETLSYFLQLNLQDEVVIASYSQVILYISIRKSH